jgi:hypothetical protein
MSELLRRVSGWLDRHYYWFIPLLAAAWAASFIAAALTGGPTP